MVKYLMLVCLLLGWTAHAQPAADPKLGPGGEDWPMVSKLTEPASCAALTSWLRASPYRPGRANDEIRKSAYVGSASVLIREGPNAEAAALQKLVYGVPVNVLSEACGEWLLVAAPRGIGFVKRDSLRDTLYGESELGEKMEQAATLQEKALWAVARAHYFASEKNSRASSDLQDQTRASLNANKRGRCETFFGACEILLKDSLWTKKRLDVDPGVSDVPLGPWWVLPSNPARAQPALLRSVWVRTSGECDCCGCEACQTTLELDFEIVGSHAAADVWGASRRPPKSWFRAPSTDGCLTAESVARASSAWSVPLYGGHRDKPAKAGEGTCIPGDDGSVWWQQNWHHPDLSETENDTVLRTFRIAKGRVVETGRLMPFATNEKNQVEAWSAEPILAWRDLDGDGRAERLMPCSFGRFCTEKTKTSRDLE